MKLICGPMATISHPAFRILVENFGGCDEYYNEMINAGTLIKSGPFEKYYTDPTPVPEKMVWQLTGRTCEQMTEASKVLLKLPGIGLDLNMGCSAPDIYRFGAGIAWMIKPRSETYEMVEKIGQIVKEYNLENPENKKRFSIKLRLGDDDFNSSELKQKEFFDFCQQLADSGVELFTLHPRTKKEKLTRPARYEFCEMLAEKMHERNVLVYLNGNVKDYASYENAIKKAPSVDGVMISRASVEKPWIFKELKREIIKRESNPDDSALNEYALQQVDMKEIAFNYISDIEKYQPVEFWKTRLQRFFTYYSMNFLFSHYAQTEFLNSKDNDDLRARITSFFEKCPEERFKKF